MKTPIAIVMLLALLTTAGCQSTNSSNQGGIAPINEEFSITVPSPNTVKQGGSNTVTVMLNRGAYFKQDVKLVLETKGIGLTPSSLLVKASDKPAVPIEVNVSRDAAIGDYRVTVTGTPEKGASTSTVFIVSVVAQ